MGRQETVDIGIGVKLDNMARDLAKMSGMTEAEAKKALGKLDKQVKKAEKRSKAAAQRSARNWQRAFEQLPFGQTITASLTSPLVGAAGALTAAGLALHKFGQDLSATVDNANLMAAQTGLQVETIGQLEYALGGAGVEVTQFKGSLSQFNSILHQNEEKIRSLGVVTRDAGGELRTTDEILLATFDALAGIEDSGARAAAAATVFGAEGAALGGVMQSVNADLERGKYLAATWYGPEAQAASAQADRDMRDLAVATRSMKDALGEAGIATEAYFLNGLTYWAALGATAVDEFTDAMTYGATAWKVALTGTEEEMDALRAMYQEETGGQDFLTRLAVNTQDLHDKMLGLKPVVEDVGSAFSDYSFTGPTLPEPGKGSKGGGGAPKGPTGPDPREQSLKALMKLTEKWAETNRDAYLATLAPLDQLQAKYADIRAEIMETGVASGDLASTEEALAQVEIALAREKADLIAEIEEETEARRQAAFDLRQANLDAEKEAQQQAARELADAWVGAFSAVGSMSSDLLAMQLDNMDTTTQQGRAEALELFRVQKGVDIAMSVANAAAGIARQYADLPLYAAIPASIAVGAATTAQIAAIAATTPTFHVGGLIGQGSMAPDEVYRATRNEAQVGVVTPQGLDAINRGDSPGQTIRVVNVYQHRAFGSFVYDNSRMPNSPLREAIRTAPRGRVGHRSR